MRETPSPSPARAGPRLLADMLVRPFSPDDAPALAELYRDSARGLGPQAYSPAQIAVWASYPDDFPAFCERLQRGVSLVSLEGGEIAGFGQLDPDDYIALLYTATRFARLGTTASFLSRSLFARHGFELIEIEHSVFKGVTFERFKMAKYLRRDD